MLRSAFQTRASKTKIILITVSAIVLVVLSAVFIILGSVVLQREPKIQANLPDSRIRAESLDSSPAQEVLSEKTPAAVPQDREASQSTKTKGEDSKPADDSPGRAWGHLRAYWQNQKQRSSHDSSRE